MKCFSLVSLLSIGMIFAAMMASAATKSQHASTPNAKPTPQFVLEAATIVSYDTLKNMAYSGESAKAIKLAQQYLKAHENGSIRILLARMLGWNKDIVAARQQLNFVLKKHPGDHDATDTLADVEFWTGNGNLAITALNNGLKYNPMSLGFLEKRTIIQAKMLAAAGHRDQAIQLAQDFVSQYDSPAVHVYLGNQFTNSKHYLKAIKQYEAALIKHHDYTDASEGLAEVEILTINYQCALDVINTGLKYAPKDLPLLEKRQQVRALLEAKTA